MAESIFAVPVMDRWLLYRPLQGTAALVDRMVLDCLNNGRRGSGGVGRGSTIPGAASQQADPPTARTGPPRPQFLGLIPTRACNIRCAYCGFGSSESCMNDRMSPDVAAAAIDWLAERVVSSNGSVLSVHFFGGEPFVAEALVRAAVAHAEKVAADNGLGVHFEASTNGVFDARCAQFVAEHFGTIVLSFDGPPEFQDRNRPRKDGSGTYEAVARTVRRLEGSGVKLCFRVCVTADNVGRLPEIVQWFCDRFRFGVVDLERLESNAESTTAGLFPPEPYEFARQFVKAARVAEAAGVECIWSALRSSEPRLTSCPVGQDTVIVSPDGRVSACYLQQCEWQKRGLDLDLGQVNATHLQLDAAAVERVRKLVCDKPRCERCYARWTCAGGCHVSITYPGCSIEYSDYCVQTRVLFAHSLLCKLGENKAAEALISSREAMETLVRHPADVIRLEGEE